MGETMNKRTAFEVLRTYNRYRRGSIGFDEMGFTPLQIGEAIDTAVEAFELDLELGSQSKTDVTHKKRRQLVPC